MSSWKSKNGSFLSELFIMFDSFVFHYQLKEGFDFFVFHYQLMLPFSLRIRSWTLVVEYVFGGKAPG